MEIDALDRRRSIRRTSFTGLCIFLRTVGILRETRLYSKESQEHHRLLDTSTTGFRRKKSIRRVVYAAAAAALSLYR